MDIMGMIIDLDVVKEIYYERSISSDDCSNGQYAIAFSILALLGEIKSEINKKDELIKTFNNMYK
jgi:hypothetical protein